MTPPPDLGWAGVLVALVGGAIRVSTPYMFVSLGETLTERSGRVNLGLEGTLVLGAMSAYGVAYLSGSPWLGVLVAGLAGALLGLLHASVCNLPRVNDIAVGIALFLLGTGLAFYLGKPFIEPRAPRLPSLALGAWSGSPQVRAAPWGSALGSSRGSGSFSTFCSSWYSKSVLTSHTSWDAPSMFQTTIMAVSIEWSWLLYLCIPLRPTVCRFGMRSMCVRTVSRCPRYAAS